ncbi:hypothetical protein [uncultured Clostridium sp.]|uniref:hypothetical protein n=1 Tax=uncultured Clostridium sp. TaxID=59620 RepID=UPI0025DCD98B|nr:hypothetical protein [uncultured Clostridium sp.]
MDIQTASNTPALVNQIIGSSELSENENGSIRNAVVNINADGTSYEDNSAITITNIETSYSHLGILSSPLTSEVLQQLKGLKISSKPVVDKSSSLLNTDLKLKLLYDETTEMLKNSTETNVNISKDTHILLALQYLVNCCLVIGDNLSDNYLQIMPLQTNDDLKEIIKNLINISISLSNSLRYMNILIGNKVITFSYAETIIAELLKSSYMISLIINHLLNIDNEDILSGETNLASIYEEIKNCCNYDNFSENNIPQFLSFKDSLSIMLISFNKILQIITHYSSDNSNAELLNILYSINNYEKSITHTASAVFLAYDAVIDNYDLIVNYIKSALSDISRISFCHSSINLTTKINSQIFLRDSVASMHKQNNISDISNSIVNFESAFNYISENNQKQTQRIYKDNLQIENNLIIKNMKNKSSNNLTATNIENIQLTLSFFVRNLKISVAGTIGSDEFTGYIYYPDTYNINNFGFNDIKINTSAEIPDSINSFKINVCLSPKLSASSVTANSLYSKSNPDSFIVNANMSFALTGEILLTAVLPIVFPQS